FRPLPAAGNVFKVTVQTRPSGADVHYFPFYDPSKVVDAARGIHAKAGDQVDLASGHYLVVAVLADGRFHEVLRLVPDDPTTTHELHWHNRYEWIGGIIHWSDIDIPRDEVTRGMSRFPAADRFTIGSAHNPAAPAHPRRIPAFYLDTMEV